MAFPAASCASRASRAFGLAIGDPRAGWGVLLRALCNAVVRGEATGGLWGVLLRGGFLMRVCRYILGNH